MEAVIVKRNLVKCININNIHITYILYEITQYVGWAAAIQNAVDHMLTCFLSGLSVSKLSNGWDVAFKYFYTLTRHMQQTISSLS